MHVKMLECIEYPDDSKWESEEVHHPAWSQIESAIRRMDRNRFPIVFLCPTTEEECHEDPEDEVFEVIGGRGAYFVSVTLEGSPSQSLHFPEHGEERMELWESDQGFAPPARRVCFDVEMVVQAARYYAEHGGRDPHLPWDAN